MAQIGEGATASPQPQSGVATPSPAKAGLEFASDIGGSLFEAFAGAKEGEANEQANKAIARFSSQQMQYADWVDQGQISSQEARMRMRNNLVKAMADNPNMAEAFSKSHESIIETAGMGKVAATGTEQEQQIFKIQEEARKNGFIQPGMSSAQEMERTYDYMDLSAARFERELAKEELAFKQAQVSLQSSQVSLASGRLSLQIARDEKKIQDATINGSRAFFPTFASNVQGVVGAVQRGELDPVAADLQIRQMMDQVQGEFRAGGATMDTSTINNLMAPYERIAETAQGTMSGQFGADVMQSQIDNAISSTELMILADPDVRALAATSSILGPAASLAIQTHGDAASRRAINIFSSNAKTEGTPQNPFASEEGGLPAYLSIMNNGMKQVNRNNNGPGAQQEADEMSTQINGLFKGVAKYADGEDFSKIKPVLKEIASDEYGQYVTGKGRGAINKENEAAVQEYTQTLFLDEIQPLIAEEWRNASTQLSALRVGPGPEGDTQEEPTSSLIRPMFTGDGVRFVKTNQAGENPRIDAEVKRLNSRVSPAVNMFIRLGAHLEEHTNYQQIYEANYANLFGDAGTGATEE